MMFKNQWILIIFYIGYIFKTVLHVAIENDSIDLVQLLLKQPKIDYNKVKISKMTFFNLVEN